MQTVMSVSVMILYVVLAESILERREGILHRSITRELLRSAEETLSAVGLAAESLHDFLYPTSLIKISDDSPELPLPGKNNIERQSHIGNCVGKHALSQAAGSVKNQIVSHPRHHPGVEIIMLGTE